MSNLSRILGDVYGTDASELLLPAPDTETPEPDVDTGATAAAEAGSEALPATVLPDWADEAVLDEAFATWVPGPPPEAPEAEHSILRDLATEFAMPEPFDDPAPRSGDEPDDSDGGPAAEGSDRTVPVAGVAALDTDFLDTDFTDTDVVRLEDAPEDGHHDHDEPAGA